MDILHCDFFYFYCDILSSKYCLLFLALLEEVFILQLSGSSRTVFQKHVLPLDLKNNKKLQTKNGKENSPKKNQTNRTC